MVSCEESAGSCRPGSFAGLAEVGMGGGGNDLPVFSERSRLQVFAREGTMGYSLAGD